jgi:hypothetical protein
MSGRSVRTRQFVREAIPLQDNLSGEGGRGGNDPQPCDYGSPPSQAFISWPLPFLAPVQLLVSILFLRVIYAFSLEYFIYRLFCL